MLSAKPKAKADNTYRDLDYLVYHKPESNNCFIIHCFEDINDKHTVTRKLNWYNLLLEIMHHTRNVEISQLSVGCADEYNV